MRTLFRRLNIGTQLTLAIFMASLIVLLMTASLFIYWKSTEAEHDVQQLAKSATDILAQDFARSITLHSPDIAIDITNKLQTFEIIHRAVFLSNEDIPIIIYTRDGNPLPEPVHIKPPHTVTTDSAFKVYTPITYHGEVFGIAYFEFTRTHFDSELAAFLQRTWLFSPVLLLLSMIVALLIQRSFSRPLRELSIALSRFGQGHTDIITEKSATSRELSQLLQGYDGMVKHISHAQRLLAEEKSRLFVILESIADGVIATDKMGMVNYINPAAERIMGWKETEILHKPVSQYYLLTDEDNTQTLTGLIENTLLTGALSVNLQHTSLQTKSGLSVRVQSSIAPIFDSEKKIIGCVIIFQNIDEARTLAQQLKYQVMHDPLTGLYNRTEFERQLVPILAGMQKDNRHVMLYIDLDQFKIINDTSGHIAGDALLKQSADLLRKTLRDQDILARLGSDEFAIFMPDISLMEAANIAHALHDNITNTVFLWEKHQYRIGVCIGIVEINTPEFSYSDLMRAADLSCYAAKDSGRNRIHVYLPEDQLLIKRHSEMKWVELIQKALDTNSFELYAQHVVSISDHATEHIEILLRYREHNGKIISPVNFLPAAERYNLAPQIDRWVIHQILTNQNLIEYVKANPHIRININLSGLSLSDNSLIEFLLTHITDAKLPPRVLCFEITETSAISDLATTAHFMRSMRLLGCEFALDDFGIGASSFAYLNNLPIDYLKIDGIFVRDIDTNPVNEAIVKSIHEIGHVMKIKTVAEFVESDAICLKLRHIGVDFAQGYYVHVPCPLQDIFGVLEKKRSGKNCVKVC